LPTSASVPRLLDPTPLSNDPKALLIICVGHHCRAG
jgi:hypothetical protein